MEAWAVHGGGRRLGGAPCEEAWRAVHVDGMSYGAGERVGRRARGRMTVTIAGVWAVEQRHTVIFSTLERRRVYSVAHSTQGDHVHRTHNRVFAFSHIL